MTTQSFLPSHTHTPKHSPSFALSTTVSVPASASAPATESLQNFDFCFYLTCTFPWILLMKWTNAKEVSKQPGNTKNQQVKTKKKKLKKITKNANTNSTNFSFASAAASNEMPTKTNKKVRRSLPQGMQAVTIMVYVNENRSKQSYMKGKAKVRSDAWGKNQPTFHILTNRQKSVNCQSKLPKKKKINLHMDVVVVAFCM